MGSRFTPRATLQATPAVCDTREGPRRPGPNLPVKWTLPDILHALYLVPDVHEISTRMAPYSATLRRVAEGAFDYAGEARFWNEPTFLGWSVDPSSDRMGASIAYFFPGNNAWRYQDILYEGPWPNFKTQWQKMAHSAAPRLQQASIRVML